MMTANNARRAALIDPQDAEEAPNTPTGSRLREVSTPPKEPQGYSGPTSGNSEKSKSKMEGDIVIDVGHMCSTPEPSGSSASEMHAENDQAREQHAGHIHTEGHEKPAVRILFLTMLCIFQGYAIMVGPCQQKFKKALDVGQFGRNAAIFTQAVDFVHWGKFIMRVGHTFFLGCFSPRQRVMIAMLFVFVGCFIPSLFVFSLHFQWIGFVFLSYGFSGMGIGIFECTFLSVITPLGGRTKSFAIVSVPVGFAVINFAGMVLTSLGMPVENLYLYVVACIPVGLGIFHAYAPQESRGQDNSNKQATMMWALKHWGAWGPMMIPCLLAKVIINFAMENITPVSFYTFNGDYVPMFSPSATTSLMQHDLFFALMALVTLIGNAISVKLSYQVKLKQYRTFVLLMVVSCLGAFAACYLVSLKVAVVNLAAVFLAFWWNGMVYGASASFIDQFVPKEYNLAAYSVWCMVGDLGPIFGGAMMDVFRAWICGDDVYTYTCRKSN